MQTNPYGRTNGFLMGLQKGPNLGVRLQNYKLLFPCTPIWHGQPFTLLTYVVMTSTSTIN